MSKVAIQETSIMTNMQEVLKAKNINWTEVNKTDLLYKSLLLSVSKFLGIHKKKETKVALVIKDNSAVFKMAGIVEYHPNEDENIPGNYSYVLTFNEEDVTSVQEVYTSFDPMFVGVAQEVSNSFCNFRFIKDDHVVLIYSGCVEALKAWLDSNAKESEVVEIELAGSFQARVGIEDGIKVLSIEPDGRMKQLVKGDATIEQ